nr:ribosomal protein L35 [Cryptomonas sp. NIES-345]BDA98423.1 ribosomal protein L35 [Cryptomonas sp. NIES-1327]
MNKLKTRRSAQKRFRRSSYNYFIRRKAFKSHLLEKKSSRRKRKLSRYVKVSYKDSRNLKSMLPYS